MGSAKSETTAHAAFSPKNHPKTSEKNEKNEPQKSQFFLQVRSSTKNVAVGHFAVFHVKCNFAFAFIDWLIVSKDVIIHRGRELGQNLHPEVKTFSVVVSSEMSPGFHILAYAVLPPNNQLVSGAQHKRVSITFKTANIIEIRRLGYYLCFFVMLQTVCICRSTTSANTL